MPDLLDHPGPAPASAGAAPAAAKPTVAPHRAVAPRGETFVFRVAMAAAALWVLDDAFWHREPGTAIGDHLASGLVPVALAALLAVAYPRLRPGARAAAALMSGPLMIVAGAVDGARHVAVDRFAGDDLTAILAGVAGVLLVALGTTVLWRSRRLDERPLRRYLRRALVAAVAALAGAFVVMPVALAIVVNHKARAPVARADLGRPYIDVSLKTSDGLRLAGWYVPSRNGAAVIAFPGRKGPVRHARMLARHGYGVLLLDRRGEGTSQGDYNARGWGGEPDLHAAIAYLRRRPDVHGGRIGGLGLSVGGELLLRTAARDAGLRAVVSEGAGLGSVAEQKHMPDTPPEPLRWIAPITMETVAGVVLSDHLPPTDLADLMPRIAPRPVLLIRGLKGNDDEALNRAYRDAGGATTTLWEIPTAGHTGGISAAPAEYESRVIGFFDRALLSDARGAGAAEQPDNRGDATLMASTAAPPVVSAKAGRPAATSPAVPPVSPRRHLAWLVGAAAGAFLVPFVVADQLGLQRDLYYALYAAAVVGLFAAWARDTGQPLRAMLARHWRLAVALGVVFGAISALIATRAEDGTTHPGGIEFMAALAWRGIVYGAADGLLLSAFPILLVFAALRDSRLRRRTGGIVAVGTIAMVSSLAMTAVYHAGYSDFRSDKLRKPATGDLIWSVPTLATVNPIGAPLAHVGLHVGAVVHNYNTDLFLPPH